MNEEHDKNVVLILEDNDERIAAFEETVPAIREDLGTGLDVTNHLVKFPPICPVVIHSSNVERVWSMHNEFRFAGWEIDRIGLSTRPGYRPRGEGSSNPLSLAGRNAFLPS